MTTGLKWPTIFTVRHHEQQQLFNNRMQLKEITIGAQASGLKLYRFSPIENVFLPVKKSKRTFQIISYEEDIWTKFGKNCWIAIDWEWNVLVSNKIEILRSSTFLFWSVICVYVRLYAKNIFLKISVNGVFFFTL